MQIITFGWRFPWKSQHSSNKLSSISLKKYARSPTLSTKLSPWKKTFRNTRISVYLSHKHSHDTFQSRPLNFQYCITPRWTADHLAKERRRNDDVYWDENIVIPRSKQLGEALGGLKQKESKWQVTRRPPSLRNKGLVAGTSLIKN